jgi:hypothetical protein
VENPVSGNRYPTPTPTNYKQQEQTALCRTAKDRSPRSLVAPPGSYTRIMFLSSVIARESDEGVDVFTDAAAVGLWYKVDQA